MFGFDVKIVKELREVNKDLEVLTFNADNFRIGGLCWRAAAILERKMGRNGVSLPKRKQEGK